MKYSFKQTKDFEHLLVLDKKAFPADTRQDFSQDAACWLIVDENGKSVGFCSIELMPNNTAFLSRAAVFGKKNQGLHKRAIKCRIKWAKAIGIKKIITYTSHWNFKSIANLIKCGFLFYEPKDKYAGKNAFYFQKRI